MAAPRWGPQLLLDSLHLPGGALRRHRQDLLPPTAVSGAILADLLLQVTEYDCLLLEFVFGQRPDDSQKVSRC